MQRLKKAYMNHIPEVKDAAQRISDQIEDQIIAAIFEIGQHKMADAQGEYDLDELNKYIPKNLRMEPLKSAIQEIIQYEVDKLPSNKI